MFEYAYKFNLASEDATADNNDRVQQAIISHLPAGDREWVYNRTIGEIRLAVLQRVCYLWGDYERLGDSEIQQIAAEWAPTANLIRKRLLSKADDGPTCEECRNNPSAFEIVRDDGSIEPVCDPCARMNFPKVGWRPEDLMEGRLVMEPDWQGIWAELLYARRKSDWEHVLDADTDDPPIHTDDTSASVRYFSRDTPRRGDRCWHCHTEDDCILWVCEERCGGRRWSTPMCLECMLDWRDFMREEHRGKRNAERLAEAERCWSCSDDD